MVAVLNILSACKAEERSGVVPPLTDDNAADGKIGSTDTMVSVRMEHYSFPFSTPNLYTPNTNIISQMHSYFLLTSYQNFFYKLFI